jgi:hypothetical protein
MAVLWKRGKQNTCAECLPRTGCSLGQMYNGFRKIAVRNLGAFDRRASLLAMYDSRCRCSWTASSWPRPDLDEAAPAFSGDLPTIPLTHMFLLRCARRNLSSTLRKIVGETN